MALVTPDIVKERNARMERARLAQLQQNETTTPQNTRSQIGQVLDNQRNLINYTNDVVSQARAQANQPQNIPQNIPIAQQSYAGDVVPPGISTASPYEDNSYGANLKRNLKRNNELLKEYVVQPTESFFYGIGKGSGGSGALRGVSAISNGTALTPEQVAAAEAQAIKNMGGHDKIVNAGELVGSMATPLGLSMVGVPAPVAFSTNAMLKKAGETNDPVDIGMAGAKAAFWSKLAGATGARYSEALGNALPITQSNLPANVLKNFASYWGGSASANYGLGSIEDLYNFARGRDVDNAQTLANSLKDPGNLVYGVIQGGKATLGDINASKAKLQQDVNKTTQNIENYKNQMAHPDTQNSTEAFKQKLAANRQEKINAEINKLAGNKYLGIKNKLDLEKAVEALRLGNKPPVEIPKAQLALPGVAGQTVQSNVQNVPQTTPKGVGQEKITTKTEILPQVQNGYTRLYRGLSQEYNPNFDRNKLDNVNGYESWTDNYDLAKQYGDNVYYTDIPTNKISDSIIDENQNSETYGDRNLIYKNDKPVGLNGINGNEYMLNTTHDNYADIKYNKATDEKGSNNLENSNKGSFSLPKQDNQGRTLNKNEQELYKNQAKQGLDEKGNLLTFYHGTPNSNFEAFKDGTYWTTNKNYADRYQSTSASSLYHSNREVNNPKTFEAHIEIKKPFDLSDPEAKRIYIDEYIKGGNALGISPYDANDDINVIDWTEGEDLREWLQENYPGKYDSIILDEGADGGYGEEVKDRGDSFLIFNNKQIHLIDTPAISTTDSLGKELTPQQQEYFKDSKVRNEEGKLLEVYHGTRSNFNVFDIQKSNDGMYGKGFHFSRNKSLANNYGKNIISAYLNITEPFYATHGSNQYSFNKESLKTFLEEVYKKYDINQEKYGKWALIDNYINRLNGDNDFDITSQIRQTFGIKPIDLINISNKLGITNYDGIIAEEEIIAFKPNQIKAVGNATPTSDNNYVENTLAEDDTEEKIAKLLEERPQREKMTLKEKADDLVTSIVNRGHFVDKLAKVSGNKQLKYKYDRMLSSANEGNYVVGEKQTNNEGKIIGKSVNEIWKPVEDAGQVQEFSNYLLHKLNIERMSLENVDELVKAEDEFGKFVKENESLTKYSPNTIKQIADGKKTIVDGKLKKITDESFLDKKTQDLQDLAKKYLELDKQVETLEGRKNKPVFGDSITADDSRAVVAEYEKNYPKFKEWSNDIKTFNKNQLQNMVDAGLTTKETQELLNTMYDNYVRIHRDLTGDIPVTNNNGRLKVNSPIKKAKGGNQDILPLKDSMAQQAIEVKKAISRNLFGQELLNTLGNGEEVEDYGEVLEEGKNGEAPTFTVFENGKPVTMKINEDLYKAIKPAERFSVEDHVISKALQKGTRFQKAVLTSKNPIFAFTNFVRDLQTATVNSKDTKKMLNNYRKLAVYKFADLYENKTGKPANVKQDNQYLRDMWELYKANGGESNTYFDFEKGTNVEPKGKVSKALKTINDKIFGLNEVIEQMPRVAEFITTLENGGTIDEAMYNAADVTVNFKRGGEVTKFLDRNGFSFLNASVQGLDKQIRNFTDNGVKGAGSYIIKCALLGIAPAVANHLLMGDDEDYNDLPNYIKDNYWLIKTGDDTFIRIPRGRDIPTFLGNLATRTTRAAQGEKNAFDGLVDTFSNTLAPNNPLEDNIFAPIKAVANNRAWNGSNIVSSSLQYKIPEQQYDAKTTEFAKWIGKNLHVSPKKVDYLLDQYSGGVGDILMPLNTKYAEERGPLSAKFMTDSVKNNKNVSLFYDMKSDLEKKKSSDVATNIEIYQLKYLNDANKKISELYKQMREVEASSLKDKEKREKATEIQKQINTLTKEAVNNAEDYGKRAVESKKKKAQSIY